MINTEEEKENLNDESKTDIIDKNSHILSDSAVHEINEMIVIGVKTPREHNSEVDKSHSLKMDDNQYSTNQSRVISEEIVYRGYVDQQTSRYFYFYNLSL